MKLFGRKSAPHEARPPLSRYGAAAITGDWPRGYEAQVRAGFVDNAIAQRAVRLVAEAVGDVPLKASSPDLAALVVARSGGQALLETVAAQLLLHGNAFIQLLDDGRGGAGELFALRPERVGPARWRLSRLWRWRRGTEATTGAQAAGDRFVLLTPDAVAAIDLPVTAIGATVRVLASGIGDLAGPAEARGTMDGASVRPPSPVQLRLAAVAGTPTLTWVRRSRAGFRWIDGGDVPLAEESEGYRVTIAPSAGPTRDLLLADRSCPLDPGEAAGGTVIEVRQVGTFGESSPTRLILS